MKKVGLLFACLFLLSLAWMSFVRQPLPSVPEIRGPLSETVTFNFSISTMDYSGVELSLNEKVEGKGMFIQFKMSNAFKTGRPGLVVNGIQPSSAFKGGTSPANYLKDEKRKGGGKDFSDFMKDSRGSSVTTYPLRHTLVEGTDGKTYLQMSYSGPAMEMLQTLEIPRPVTVPAHISRKFVPEGIIQFQPGAVTFDSKINGFNIPVVIR